LTYTDVEHVEGEAGDFRVTLVRKPRYVLEDKCRGCTTCVEYCPVTYPDQFNQGISKNKAIHIYFAQAIPLITYIDENCLHLKARKCRICEGVCENQAIDFTQTPEKLEVKVAAIILSPGLEPFDPKVGGEYGYGKMQNVVTSMDYERMMCTTGPYEGEILRPSDKRHPRRIAWIQCVGSRQVNPQTGNSYCSAVCCTYTQKQVILTKEHDAEAACTVFHNDIRSHGKDFERFYQRAEGLSGVRFIRSYVSIGTEVPGSRNATIRYSTPDDGVKEEEFDLVVLSVGLNPPADAKVLARTFGVELNAHGFCRVNPVNPMETTRPGIFVSGAFLCPADIPESVFTASGAGAQCGELLDYRRGKLAKERVYPPERDVSKEEPRIGVFVCHCGANIGRVVDVPETVEYCKTLPNVVYAQEQLFSCAANCAQEITDVTRDKGLNRVIVAACSPRTLEPLFRDTVREAGLNQYYYEMANIREHCSWVHATEKEEATQKAKDIIRMSVARACHLAPLQEIELPVNRAALVVGGGIAGMTCALSVANQGHEVHLVERETHLGGTARRIYHTLEGLDVQAHLHDLVHKVYRNPLIHVYTGATITGTAGYIGNFATNVQSERGATEIKHGATVIAVGADVYRPAEYLYGEDDRVMTHLELEEQINKRNEKVINAESLVMIQCVGCRNEDRDYCSRICCSESIKNALKLKEINPKLDIYVLFRDVRTYGFSEDCYWEAAYKGVKFIRYEPPDEPEVKVGESEEGRPVLKVTAPDDVLGKKVEIDADVVALAAAIIPCAGSEDVSRLFKVSLGQDRFFQEAHVKLRPVEFAADGVYVCGMAHYPKLMRETTEQAYGAAGRVLALLSHDTVTVSGSVCEVDEKKCVGCGACISACSYGAIEFRETRHGKKAAVNPVLCKGDGLCNAKCPTGAIQLKHFTDEEIWAQIDAVAEAALESAVAQTVRL
jgi:heterodisulfide reductase subunit A